MPIPPKPAPTMPTETDRLLPLLDPTDMHGIYLWR